MPPAINRPLKPSPAPPVLSHGGDILDTGVAATDLKDSRITAVCYGRNGVGKTTFACQGGASTALISIEPAPTGGAKSVAGWPNITVYQAAADYLSDPKTGYVETVKGSDKVLAIIAALQRRFDAGQKPFKKVVLDGVTSWSDVILGEVMGVEYANMPAVLGLGKVHVDQYTERGERLVRYLKPFFKLPCDLWVIAQERDHNPPRTETTTKSGKEYKRPTQTPFMREAHPMAQEGSFFSLGIADTPAKFVQDACDNVLQLYEDNEWREERGVDVPVNGEVIPGQVTMVPTGRRVKRLRCQYHTNYAARIRAGDYRNVPEWIEADTPAERYQALMDVIAGKRTKYGYYPERRG